jgi:hypothetical protein
MRRRVWLLVAVLTALLLAFGTGGFSAAQVDRAVQVSVAEDPNGYVGITYLPDSVRVPYGSTDGQGNDPRSEVHVLTIENNLDDRMALTVVVTDSSGGPPKLENSRGGEAEYDLGGFDPGESALLDIPVVCAANGATETWQLRITAHGGDIDAILTREVTIECRPPHTPKKTPT